MKEEKLKLDRNAKDVSEEELRETLDQEVEVTPEEKKLNDKKKVKKVKTNIEFPYVIELYDILGSASKRTARFGAKRLVFGSNVWLVNEKYGFKEPFPEDNDEYKSYKLDEVNKEISKTEDKIQEARKGLGNHSERDLIEDLRILKGYSRSIQLSGVGSYMIFDSNEAGGKPMFMFDRRGNFKLPVYKNIDISLLYIPNEANISDASDLLKENDEKNGNKSAERLYQLTILALMSLTFLAMFYFLYRQGSLSTEISGNMINVTRDLSSMADFFQKGTENLVNVSDSIVWKEPTPTVTPNVEGVN